jgi:hypothetical protein
MLQTQFILTETSSTKQQNYAMVNQTDFIDKVIINITTNGNKIARKIHCNIVCIGKKHICVLSSILLLYCTPIISTKTPEKSVQ